MVIESREASDARPAAPPKTHRFLARTFTPARWSEYEDLLELALEEGWVPMSLERWIVGDGVQDRVLILRHDVDQHPATALRMAGIEASFGVRATWYFRWRTCSPRVIDGIRNLGGTIGFHYETLTRLALQNSLQVDEIDQRLVEAARDELAVEVSAFAARFGPVRSICAHGDTRVPGVSNQVLVRGQEPGRFGVEFDANEALSRHTLGLWMTDRTSTDGRWKDGIDPGIVFRDEHRPVLCLTHPNNWCSGLSLWVDRLSATILPEPQFGRTEGRMGVRTRRDQPPGHAASDQGVGTAAAPGTSVTSDREAALETSMSREVLRHHYDSGEHSQSGASTGPRFSAHRKVLAVALKDAQFSDLAGRAVIEFGCGFGESALWMSQAGGAVTAVDSSARRLEVGSRVAAEHGLAVDWVLGAPGECKPGWDERYDLAVLRGTWLREAGRRSRRQVLRSIFDALRPGGILAIREPPSGLSLLPRHTMLKAALRQAGFTMVRELASGQAVGDPRDVLRAVRPSPREPPG